MIDCAWKFDPKWSSHNQEVSGIESDNSRPDPILLVGDGQFLDADDFFWVEWCCHYSWAIKPSSRCTVALLLVFSQGNN